MSKHTPGPWVVRHSQYVKNEFFVQAPPLKKSDPYGIEILSDEFYPTKLADAHLVAAAPDLLEAAELGLSECESYIHDNYDGTHTLNVRLAVLEPIRKAIKKARGEGE